MTIRQLALLAEVAPVTVSMALRDHPRISTKTRERIQRLAREHHYRVDGKVTELMRSIRIHSSDEPRGCIGLISLYPDEKPWDSPSRAHLRTLVRGMTVRAEELGYRVEPFWVRQPGMKPSRLRTILQTRGIEGLLCAGGAVIGEELPPELDPFAVVTAGVSVATPIHRVVAHSSRNTSLLLDELRARNYRRPGVIMDEESDVRTSRLISAMYLYYARYRFGGLEIPIFLAEGQLDFAALQQWLSSYRPDVLVECAQRLRPGLRTFLAERRIRVPEDLGLVSIETHVHNPELSGMRLHNERLGREAAELLVSLLRQRDLGRPKMPKLQLIEGEWNEGRTIRPRLGPPLSTTPAW